MGKRAWISLPIIVVLLAGIVVQLFLLNTKIDSSKVTRAGRIAAYIEPAVVQVHDYAIVQWDYSLLYHPSLYIEELALYMEEVEGLAYVGGSGSGAIITPNGYIVTNAHVVATSQMSDEEVVAASLESMALEIQQIFGYDANAVYNYLSQVLSPVGLERWQKVVLPDGDQYDIDVKAVGESIEVEGKDVAILKIDGKNLPTIPISETDTLQLQDSVWVSGYPGSADISSDRESQLVSTTTSGEVSAKDKKFATGTPFIQYSAPTSPGSSGGPVVNKDGELVGIHAGGDPTRTGFAIGMTLSTIEEFIAQSGAKPSSSPVDTLYKEGLEFFWAGYYEEALDRFLKVQQLYEKHPKIKDLISDSRAKIGESKIYWPKYKTYFYIYDGVAAVIIIFLIIFAFVLKPKQIPQTPDSPEPQPEKGTE